MWITNHRECSLGYGTANFVKLLGGFWFGNEYELYNDTSDSRATLSGTSTAYGARLLSANQTPNSHFVEEENQFRDVVHCILADNHGSNLNQEATVH